MCMTNYMKLELWYGIISLQFPEAPRESCTTPGQVHLGSQAIVGCQLQNPTCTAP